MGIKGLEQLASYRLKTLSSARAWCPPVATEALPWLSRRHLPRKYHRRTCAGAAGAARSWRFCSWGPPRALLSRWGTPRTKRLGVTGRGPPLSAFPPPTIVWHAEHPHLRYTLGCPIPQTRPAPHVSLRQRPHAAAAHHTVGVAAVTLHTVLHQLLLIQIAGSAVRASEGRPVGDIAGNGRTLSQPGLSTHPDFSQNLPCPLWTG